MRSIQKHLAALVFGMALASLSVIPAGAGGALRPESFVARVNVGPAGVDWSPVVDAERLVLTVAGPGDLYIRQELKAGQRPSLSLFDKHGQRLPDGMYTYELRAMPKASRELSKRSAVQTGYLRIRDGSFVTYEPAPVKAAPATPRQITDKQIISQGLCVGGDCAAGDEGFPLRLKDSFVQIRFEDVFDGLSSSRDWALQTNEISGASDSFSIRDLDAASIPFLVEGGAPDSALYVRSNGNLGLGTATPSTKLHVFGNSGTTKVFIQEASSTTTPRELFEIRNNGSPVIIFKDTSIAQRWANGTFGSSFVVDEQANSGLELVLTNTGNLTIAGTLTQNSDRDTKRDLLPVSGEEVLTRLARLPISTWNLKTDDPAVRHMGPMAQDFAAVFGLGEDERHIAPLDVAGVSLAALQALDGKLTKAVTDSDTELAQLRRENAQLTARLATLEALVSAMTVKQEE